MNFYLQHRIGAIFIAFTKEVQFYLVNFVFYVVINSNVISSVKQNIVMTQKKRGQKNHRFFFFFFLNETYIYVMDSCHQTKPF